jgi:hypothetical protein
MPQQYISVMLDNADILALHHRVAAVDLTTDPDDQSEAGYEEQLLM